MILNTDQYMLITDEMIDQMYTTIFKMLIPLIPILVIVIAFRIGLEILMAKIERKRKIEHNLNIHINKEELKQAIREVREEDEHTYKPTKKYK